MNIRRIIALLLACIALFSAAFSEGPAARTEYDVGDASLRSSFSTIFTEGHYKCGFVIDAGEYNLIATEEGARFSVSAASGEAEILFSGQFSGNAIVQLKAGDTIEFEKCFAVPSDEFYETYVNDRSAAGIMLKAGAACDLLPGEYCLTAAGEGARYAIYGGAQPEMPEGVHFDGVVSVSLREGEYILLENCAIEAQTHP